MAFQSRRLDADSRRTFVAFWNHRLRDYRSLVALAAACTSSDFSADRAATLRSRMIKFIHYCWRFRAAHEEGDIEVCTALLQ